MSKSNEWFVVDKEGLKQIESGRAKHFILYELISNAFDENVTKCNVTIKTFANKHLIVVKDDSPNGFKSLTDSYTLFAPSYKKGNVEQRGRFNLGEKLVLSMFETAKITSTTGTIIFNKDGTRNKSEDSTDKGSVFEGFISKNVLTKDEVNSIVAECSNILVPNHIVLTINEKVIEKKKPLKVIRFELPTVGVDKKGNLFDTHRITDVEVYKTPKSYICEMGIPIVETDMSFSVNVLQKIPLNKDRDNVKPIYLRKLQTGVLDAMYEEMSEDDIKSSWVNTALEKANEKATSHVFEVRHGEDAVTFSPADPESSKKAMADGREVVYAGSYSGKVWQNVRNHREENPNLVPSSSSLSQYQTCNIMMHIDGNQVTKVTEDMERIANKAKSFHIKLFNDELNVTFYKNHKDNAVARYGKCDLYFNTAHLSQKWFNWEVNKEDIMALIIHEFGHWYTGDHLSSSYNDALCKIGAKLYLLEQKCN